MRARFLAAAACGAAVALSACGGSDAPATPGGAGQPPDPNDKRGVAYTCLTRDKQLAAKLTGKQSIQVDGRGGPRIDFFVSGGEAEGQQFSGNAQGAEQIGSALLYVKDGTEDQLKLIEQCLEDQ